SPKVSSGEGAGSPSGFPVGSMPRHLPRRPASCSPHHMEATTASLNLAGTAWLLLLAGTAPSLLDATASAHWDTTPLLLHGTAPLPLAAAFALSDHTTMASSCFNDATASAGALWEVPSQLP
ncbi:hypothetical protein P7K49_039911, partial [Saguinus oedipus]